MSEKKNGRKKEKSKNQPKSKKDNSTVVENNYLKKIIRREKNRLERGESE